MTTLLRTTRQRRSAIFFGGWVYIVAAIILRVVNNPSGPMAIITTPGGVYRNTRDVLEVFAVEASVDPIVILILYTVIGLVATTFGLYVLDVYAFEQQDYIQGLFNHGSGQFIVNIVVLYMFIAIFLFALLLFGAAITGQQTTVSSTFGPQHKLIPNWGIFTTVLLFVLMISPQFLTLVCLGVLLSVFTALVP